MTVANLEERQAAYRACFGSPAGQEVLKDLMIFCRGVESLAVRVPSPDGQLDTGLTCIAIGRNEVLKRIMEHANIPLDLLYLMYGGQRPQAKEDEDNG